MRNIFLTLEYDGTNFHGWQRQPKSRSVQGELEKIISKLCCQKIELVGASRTDAGVHAKDQKASFTGDFDMPLDTLVKVANQWLPIDIKIIEAKELPVEIHARFDAKGKSYSYRIINSSDYHVFDRRFNTVIEKKLLDVEKMKEASIYFLGTHDFKPFSANSRAEVSSTIRTINNIKVTWDEELNILIEVEAKAFLYKMVRMMVGALIDIGMGKNEPIAIKEILEGRMKRIGRTAPPEGLFLEKVYFDEKD
jgi:tRNA pseudouridine38-40 synthase